MRYSWLFSARLSEATAFNASSSDLVFHAAIPPPQGADSTATVVEPLSHWGPLFGLQGKV